MSNPFYNKVNQNLAAQYGFVIETFQQPLLQQFQLLIFFQTNGTPIGTEFMRSTVLTKL